MSVNVDTLNAMLRHFRDDRETLDDIVMALETFETYHQAIYALEITRRLNACGAMDSETYREQYPSGDKRRTRNHNAVLAQVNLLNRIAGEAGLPPFYDGVVSEERPYRRQVADAVLEFVDRVMRERI